MTHPLLLFLLCTFLSACGLPEGVPEATYTSKVGTAVATITIKAPSPTATNVPKPFDAATSEAFYNLGLEYYSKGEIDNAILAYDQAIQLKPDYAEAFYARGLAYRNKDDLARAISDYTQAIQIKPDYAFAYCNLGRTYGKLGRYSEAIEAFEKATRIKSDDAPAHYGLGLAYFYTKKKSMAVEQYEILKNLDVQLANKLYNVIYK